MKVTECAVWNKKHKCTQTQTDCILMAFCKSTDYATLLGIRQTQPGGTFLYNLGALVNPCQTMYNTGPVHQSVTGNLDRQKLNS